MIFIFFPLLILLNAFAQQNIDIPVSVIKVKEETIKQFYRTNGVLKSDRSIYIKPEVSGRITEIFVEEGDFVEEGTPLIAIQTDKYDFQYSSQLYLVRKLKAIYSYKKNIYEKKKYLYKKELISKDEYDIAKLEMETAYNDLKSAEEKLKELERLRKETQIRTPFSGFVDKKLVSEGDFVNSNSRLFYIVDLNSLKAVFQLPQRFIKILNIGDYVDLDIEGIGKLKGRVTYVSYSLTENSLLTYKAEIEEMEGLRENMYTVVKVLEKKVKGFKIPERAVHMGQKGDYVFVIKGGVVKKKRVEILGQTYGYLFVKGLKDGDMVVVSTPFGIREGSKVRVEEIR